MTPAKIRFSDLDPSKWKKLVEQQQGFVPFYDTAILESYSKFIHPGGPVAIVLESDQKYLLALPGTEQNNIFSNLFFRTFDNLDMLTGIDATEKHKKVFVNFIHQNFKGIILRNFYSGSALFHIPGKFISGPKRNCPYMNLPGSAEDIFPAINKSFKKTLRWNLNGLPKLGVTSEVLTGKNVQIVFEKEFMPAHLSRMEEKKMKSGFADVEVQNFFRSVNNSMSSGAILTVARLNGVFAGGIYGNRSGNTFAYIASGIRSDIEKFSVGQFLIFKTMEYLIADRCKRFDFLRGTESYKKLWSKDTAENETRYYYRQGGAISVFKIFLKENRKRYGRLKCIKLFFNSWMQPERTIH